MRSLSQVSLLCVALLALAACGSASATTGTKGGASSPGVTADSVSIGATNALTGTAGTKCTPISRGEQAYISSVNDKGGVNGRKIKLTVVDDGYLVGRAVANVQAFMSQPVFAMVGGCGSSTANAIYSTLNDAGIPFLFPYVSIAGFLEPPKKYLFSILPLYQNQDTPLIKAAFKKYGPGSVYMLASNLPGIPDAINTAEKAVVAAGGTWLGSATETLGTADVTPFVIRMKPLKPDYVLFNSGAVDGVRMVNSMIDQGALPSKRILGFSVLADKVFVGAIPQQAQSITTVVASTPPGGTTASAVCDDVFKKYDKEMVGLSDATFGCAQGQLFVAALKLAGKNPTRDGLVQALEGMKNAKIASDLPSISFSSSSHLGTESLFILTYKNGTWGFEGLSG